jgi:glycosyltransferase involved in cell wall biosynthesis
VSGDAGGAAARPRRATIVVQNLPIPLDRRVWSEACALRDAGWRVSIVAHRGVGQRWHEVLEGIECCRYPAPPQARGLAGYVVEFGWCWLMTFLWCARLEVTRGIDVLHACNPPDTFFLIAWLLRPFGVRSLFDQHDLCPELLQAKSGLERPRLLDAILWLERRTYRAAHAVISPNESYAEIARRADRGGKPAESVFVVRSAPPRGRFVPAPPDAVRDARWRRGRAALVGYIGVMGRQDGVLHLLRATAALVAQGRDVGVLLIGDGDEFDALQRLARKLSIAERVEFTGRVHDLATIAAALSSCDLCACPDPRNAFNDRSSMNKIVEYMALGKPVAGFALQESARTLAGGGELAAWPEAAIGDSPTADPARLDEAAATALARAMARLLDDPGRAAALGRQNRARFEAELCWERQVPALLAAYSRVVGSTSTETAESGG